VPNDIRLYSSQVADYVDRHLERASNALRETLSSAPWLPESARPRPPPAARSLVDSAAAATTYARVQHWVATNKLKVTIGLVSVGGIVYLLMREKRHRKKRRAKKAGNGARLEVVVVAGSPSEPITRSISLDLERRGFIVYVVCNTIEEEVLVHNESRPDIRPLMIDIVDVSTSTTTSTSVLTSTAREYTRLYRAFHAIPPISTRCLPGCKAPPSNLPLSRPGPIPKLPFLANRHFIPLDAQRPAKYPPADSHPDPAILPPNSRLPECLTPALACRFSTETIRASPHPVYNLEFVPGIPRSRIQHRCCTIIFRFCALLGTRPSGHPGHTS
jgi:hypothetical protein